jgi:hypothetical protein
MRAVSRLRVAVIHVAIPLVLGALSYVALRSWIPILGAHAALWHSPPALLRDHFADAAWGWALGGFVSVMWQGERRTHLALWTVAAAVVAAGLECAEASLGWGSFDRGDLVAQTAAVLLAAITIGGMHRWTSAREAH